MGNFPEWQHKFTSVRKADSIAKEWGRKYVRISVEAGLHYLQGNDLPYFSVTADLYAPGHKNNPFACGCQHDLVLKFWPKLKPVVDLHLSYSDGSPSHSEANAWYDLAGYYGGAGERYHAGNSERNFDAPAPPDKPWMNYEHRKPTLDECLGFFAEHVRIPVEQARELAESWRPPMVDVGTMNDQPWRGVRAQMAAWIETQRPRWQREATAACELLDQMAGRLATV